MKQLGHSNDVAPEFEARVAALIDKRHILIHRWFVENGWPGEHDADEIVKLISLAQEIQAESRLITRTLAEYILKSSAEFSDVREQLVGIFKNVNVGGNRKDGEVRTPEAAQPGAAPDDPRG